MKKWIFGITNAIYTLHEKNIFHNNLIPSSIIISESGEALVSKFGFGFENLIETLHQNHPYFAPEVFDNLKFSSETDIYSMGVLFIKLLTLKDIDVSELTEYDILNQIPSDFKKNLGENQLKLIISCVKENPSERTKIKDLYLEFKKWENENKQELKEIMNISNKQKKKDIDFPKERESRSKGPSKNIISTPKSSSILDYSPAPPVQSRKSKQNLDSKKESVSRRTDIIELDKVEEKKEQEEEEEILKEQNDMDSSFESGKIKEKSNTIITSSKSDQIFESDQTFQSNQIFQSDEEYQSIPESTKKIEPMIEVLQKKKKKDKFELDENVLEFSKKYADSPEKISIVYSFTRDVLQAQELKKQKKDYSIIEQDLLNRLDKLPESLKSLIDKKDILKGDNFINTIEKENNIMRLNLSEEIIITNRLKNIEEMMNRGKMEEINMMDDLSMNRMEYKSSAKKSRSAGFSISFPEIKCDCFKPKIKEPTEKEIAIENQKKELKNGQERKENYNISKVLGEGCSGSVYLVKPKNKEEIYVMKVFKTGNEGDANQEIAALKELQGNKGIVEFIEEFSFDDGYGAIQRAIVMEYCEKGDLTSITKKRKGKTNITLNEMEIIEIMIQIFDSLNSIHSKEIIHRDIKPANIFMKNQRKIKIGDFGFAIQINKTQDPILGGSLEYMAPEQWENKTSIGDYAIDIWSAGCILLEILTKKVRDVKVEISSNPDFLYDIWIKEKLNFSEKLRDILNLCFSNNPKERPKAKTLQTHLNILLIQHLNCITIQSCIRGYLQRKINLENK